MMFRKNEKGFTLLEALLVIVIIGIIAGIALPRILSSKAEAQKEACRANLASMNMQVEKYYVDTGTWPTLAAIVGTDTTPTSYFPDGPPKCPKSGVYSLGSNNRIACSLATSDGHKLQ